MEDSTAWRSTIPIHEQPKSGDEILGAVLDKLPKQQPLVHIRRGLRGHIYKSNQHSSITRHPTKKNLIKKEKSLTGIRILCQLAPKDFNRLFLHLMHDARLRRI